MYKNPRATAKALALSGLADRLEQAYEDEIAAVEKAKQLAEMEKQRRADAIKHAQEAADARERQILEERRKQAAEREHLMQAAARKAQEEAIEYAREKKRQREQRTLSREQLQQQVL